MNNIFIVLEGVDGSGKSSVAKELSKQLGAKCIATPHGRLKALRKYFEDSPIIIRFFYFLITLITSSFEINKQLKTQSVVCDRYLHSTWIYHIIYGLDFLEKIPLEKILPIKTPDYIFLLTVNEERRKIRILGRENTKKDTDSTTIALVQEKYRSFNDLFEIDTSNIDVNQVVSIIMNKIK